MISTFLFGSLVNKTETRDRAALQHTAHLFRYFSKSQVKELLELIVLDLLISH